MSKLIYKAAMTKFYNTTTTKSWEKNQHKVHKIFYYKEFNY